MKKIFFSFSVDCESTQHRVKNPELGERSTRGLGELFQTENLKGAFFVIPSDIEIHARLYQKLEADGHEVGLHLHPAELGYEEFCGVYGPDDQYKIIREATDRFSQAMGRHPIGFSMGYASCNDYTFPVLAELGYRHGRCSIPTRILPECASVWAGAPLDIHYAHRFNRLLHGDLDFVNVPGTLDPESRLWGGKHPQDLRVELVDAKNHWYTIDKAVKRQLTEQVPVLYVQAVTHNVFEFSDPQDFRRQTVVGIIQAVRQIAETSDLMLVPTTIEEISTAYRQIVPLATSYRQKLSLDTRGQAFNQNIV